MLKYCTVFGEKIRPVEIERETKNFVVMQNGIRRAFLCTTFDCTLCCRSASDLLILKRKSKETSEFSAYFHGY
jgi:hypothetical protein